MPPEPEREHSKDEPDNASGAVKNSDSVQYAYRNSALWHALDRRITQRLHGISRDCTGPSRGLPEALFRLKERCDPATTQVKSLNFAIIREKRVF